MTRYVALLRGINVGGRTRLAMADLRRLALDLGHTEVETYLQSGNLLFSSPAGRPARLAGEIERRIAKDLGLSVTVLLRTGDELARVVAANPFLGGSADLAKLHVTFLAEAPDPERAAGLEAPAGEPDELSLAGREVYLHTPDGYGRSKLSNAFLEKRLGVAATTRNWKTVGRLRDLASSAVEGA
jgi:uncharacterized protein (DUF1697 family)